ncbi:ABC transporter permease [Enterococcus songbeiensis]|uniref:ABC transporter permease n=1 Tax=Enterococcus songbeiensis TaxID=2559927 RepID=UPI0010F6F967|nr:ABC transporter permease [Enterococcus songbeiensis]
MNFMKRGLQSIWAKKGRSLLLIAVFSAILIFVLAGLTIRSAAETAVNNAKKSVGATVTLSVNRESMFKQKETSSSGDTESERPDPGSFSMTPVNLADAEKIAALAGVKSYSFESSASADKSTGIEPISSEETESTETESTDTENQMGGPGGMQAPGGETSQGDFQITGVSTSASYSDFSSGTAELVDGEAITNEDEGTNNVLIEKALADANELAVGDTFKIKNSEDEDVEVTVKGIYETSETGDSMGMKFNFMNPANTLIASYTFANDLNGEDSSDTIDSAVYNLEDPQEMAAFVKEAEKLIDTDTFSLQTNDQMYQQMLQPLTNVSSFAKNIVLLVAVAGVIILTLIVMMSIRERKYEIGVLLSLGESRAKVIWQFFVEIVVCMVVALGIASVSGNLVGNAVGNQLLAQQSETTTAAQTPGQGQEGGPGGQAPSGGRGEMKGVSSLMSSQEVEELNIAVKPMEILSLSGIGLGISMFSILLSSAGILRLNPKKILIS